MMTSFRCKMPWWWWRVREATTEGNAKEAKWSLRGLECSESGKSSNWKCIQPNQQHSIDGEEDWWRRWQDGAHRDDADDVERSDVIIQGVDALWGFKLLLPSPMTTSWVGSQRRRWNDERRVQLWLFNKHFHFVTFLVSRELDIIHCFIAMSSKVGGKIREGGGVSFRSGPICFGHGCNNS